MPSETRFKRLITFDACVASRRGRAMHRRTKRWRFLFDKSETLLDTGTVPETLPAWLTEADRAEAGLSEDADNSLVALLFDEFS
jgi:hypothetical protein